MIKKKCDKCGKLARHITYHCGIFQCGRCHHSGRTQGRKARKNEKAK